MAGRGRGRGAGSAPEVGDESETDACNPCRSLEMKQLFGEFHMLYQERLHQLEIMDDAQEEVLRMKVRLLQSYVVDLSDQNNVLVQMMEELERETEWKVAALKAELQRPSLAQRPVPTEHLSGSTATQITVTPPEQMIEQEELRVQMASKEQLIHQLNVHLREATHSQEKSKAEVLEKEVKIQELQEIITVLHHDIYLKDSETVNQLQEKHLLETTEQSLRQLLDAHEQRIYQVQTKQTARQAELEQKCSWIQQLEQDLEASRRLQEESQRQLGECHVPLAQVAGENEALQSQQLLETETLMSSLRTWEKASGNLSCEMPEHQWEEQAELQQRRADVQDELQKKEAATHRLQAELGDAGLLTQEAKTQLAEVEKEVVTMRRKYSKAQKELLQREAQKADLVAAQEERSRCRAQLSELRADQPRQAVELAVRGEKQQTAQQEGTESIAEVGGLKGKLHQLQDDIRSLQDICGERAKAMAEQTCCMQQLQHEREIGITQSQNQATLVEQLQGELKSCKQAHQTDLEQLRAKLQHLQQELDVCKEKNQANLSRLQQRECMTERQSLALEFLLQQCQALKDEGLYYEEVVQKQERELSQQQEQLREAQEHLAVAESKSRSTESSLELYKKKYQASLTRAGELEGKVQRLQEDLQDMSSQQEAIGRCSQRAVEQLTQALHATEEELCRSRQHAHHCEQSIQGLREQLAASQTQRVADEERLVTVQAELASYMATHSHSNASYRSQAARAETLQQKLSQADGESAQHSQRAEEYQQLLQDLKLELLSVSEQKTSARKELRVLELQVQSLRQEVAAEGERKQLEVSRMQQLEGELRASRRLCAQKEQIAQRQGEQLRQAHGALQEKGLELDRQRAEARSLDVRLQQAQQEKAQSQAASSALREELQLLRQSLQDSQQQQQEAAQALAQQEEKLAELGRREAELRALQERVSSSEEEAAQSRTLLGQLTSELSQWQQRHQGAVQQGHRQQHAAAQLELKLRRSQEEARALQQQLQEQDASQQELREELSRRQGREDELQRQVQGAQERTSLLASERAELQRQLREQARQGGRSQLEEEGQRLREQLRQCRAQLERTSRSLGQAQQRLQQQAGEVTRQETALARLQEELEAAQARERQSSRRLSAAEATLQELTLTAASCHESQSQALEQLREKVQEAGALQAELVRAQQREAQLQAEQGAHEERLKRLHGELKKLQGFQQQSEQEARCCAEQLGQRSSQAQQWQRRHQASTQALAQREEELLVCRVELASLKEKLHGAAEERHRLQQDLNGVRQKFVASSSEVEVLRSSLGAARSDSRRLQHESELVLANVSQWVQEQKQVNEKLGHKIRAQVKHIAQLTGEKEHLQEVLVHLQQENRCLKGKVDERHIECERLKARGSSSSDVGAGLGQPWALLLGEE